MASTFNVNWAPKTCLILGNKLMISNEWKIYISCMITSLKYHYVSMNGQKNKKKGLFLQIVILKNCD